MSMPSNFPHSQNHPESAGNEPDDQSWLTFIQQHQPAAPPAHPDLEDWILQEINTKHLSAKSTPGLRHRLTWAAMAVLACGSIAIWVNNQRQLQIAQMPPRGDLAQVQNFIEQSYDGVYVNADETLN